MVRFLATIAPAARLSPEHWGLYSVLVATVEVVRAITNFGLDAALVRWLTVYHEAAGDVLHRILRIKTWLAAAGIIGLAIYAFTWSESIGSPWLLVLLAISLFPFGWAQSQTSRFQAHHAMHWLIPVQIAVGTSYLGAVSLASFLNASITVFIILAVSYEVALCGVISFIGSRVLPSEPNECQSPRSTGQLFWEGLPLGGLSIAAILYARLGVFILQRVGTLAEVGYLFFAMKTGEQISLLGSPISISSLPVFTHLIQDKRARAITRIFVRYSLGGALISISIASALTLFAQPLIHRFKPEYVAAIPPLIIMAWSAVFMFQNHLSIGVVTAFGKFRLLFVTTVLNLVVNVSLAIWLVPRFGAAGAALAVLGTESLHCLVQLVVVITLVRLAP
jgi:O-antigen/teichoic acid export membrane protein